MAGLDTKRQSDFISMLQEVAGESARIESLSQHMDPVELSTHTIRSIQMVNEWRRRGGRWGDAGRGGEDCKTHGDYLILSPHTLTHPPSHSHRSGV